MNTVFAPRRDRGPYFACAKSHPGGELQCPMCPGVSVVNRICPCCGTQWGRTDGSLWIIFGPGLCHSDKQPERSLLVYWKAA